MSYDATSLDQELRAAGLLIAGCSSEGRIDWVSPPTQQERQIAQQVLAAHDPDRRERDEYVEDADRRVLIQRLISDTVDEATWLALTAQRRSEDARLGLRALAVFARRIRP
jgi:hypothetical protein